MGRPYWWKEEEEKNSGEWKQVKCVCGIVFHNDIEIVEEDIQDVVKPVFRQFRSAQIRYFYD